MFWELYSSFFLSFYKGLHPTLILFVAIRNPGKGRNYLSPLCNQWILGDVMLPAFPPAEQALQTRVSWDTAELCNISLMTDLQGHPSLWFTQGVVFLRMPIAYVTIQLVSSVWVFRETSKNANLPFQMSHPRGLPMVGREKEILQIC